MKTLIRLLIVASLALSLQASVQAADNDDLQETFRTLEKNYSLLEERLNNSTTALETIRSLTPGKDLKEPLADYSRNIDKFDGLNKIVAGNVSDFNKQLDSHYATWQKQIDQIQTPALRSLAARQKSDQQADTKNLNDTIGAAQGKIDPLLVELKDIQTYLKANLTASSVTTLAEPLRKADEDAKAAQQNVELLKQSFMKARHSISSTPQ